MFSGGVIASLALAFVVMGFLAFVAIIALSYREQLTWLISMMARPLYLYRLHKIGDDDIPRHSIAYVWAVQHRSDDRDRLTPQMNAWIDAAIPELNKLYDNLLGR